MTDKTQGASVEAELLPCPMCGCKGAFEYGAPMTSGQRIVKARCSIGCVEQNIYRCDEAQAASAWNSRTPAPASARELPPSDDDVERRLRAQAVAPFGPQGFALLIEAAQCIADLRAQLARQGQGEAVGTVLLHEGAKIIDGSLAFMDAAPIGTQVYASPASAPPADEVRTALQTIHDTFKRDLDQGYKTRDKEYAVAVAAQTLSAQPDRGAAQELPYVEGWSLPHDLPTAHAEIQKLRIAYADAVARAESAAPHSQPVRGVPDDQLRQLLQEFVDYHSKPAGLTLETAMDTDRLGEFLGNVEAREKDMVARAKAMLAAAPSPAAQPVAPLAPVSLQGAQVGGQSEQPSKIEITREGAKLWHTNCPKNRFKSGVMREARREEGRSLIECLHCGKRGYYPIGGVGRVCVDEVEQPHSTATEGADGMGGAA